MYVPSGFLKAFPNIRRRLKKETAELLIELEAFDSILQFGVDADNSADVQTLCESLCKMIYPLHVAYKDLFRNLSLIEAKAKEQLE